MKHEEITQETTRRILTIPNLLSFFRLCLIPVFAWLYCVQKEYIWTGIVLVISGLTDTADGLIARHFHMTSDLGKVLDPVADKLTQAAIMVVKEIFMAITGLLVIRKTGSVFGADWHGKVTTWLLYAMMVLHLFWYNIPEGVSRLLIGICAAMLLLSFALYGIHHIRTLRGTQTEK